MYRENIYEVAERTGEKISTLVVPKNTGLKGYAWKVLKEAGLDLDEATEAKPNQLNLKGLTLLLRRGEDIPQIVEDEFRNGRVVLGLTGDDLFDEYKLRKPSNTLRTENTYDWYDERARFLRPTLCLVNTTGSINGMSDNPGVAVNSKYEFISRDYLQRSELFSGRNPNVVVYNGDLEDRVSSGATDCGIDMVYTGNSLDQNGLKVVQKIRFSDLVVISALKSEESFFGRVIRKEYGQIAYRYANPTDSLTSQLLQSPEALGKKGAAEMTEFILALVGAGKDPVEAESADLLYITLVGLVQQGKNLDDVAKILASRQK